MANKTMVRAAVTSLLFGGTLGASMARADVVGSLNVTDALVNMDMSGTYCTPATLAAALAGDMAYANGDSITLSPFTASGFSITANTSANNGTWTVWEATFTFTALANMTANLSGDFGTESAIILFQDFTANSMLLARISESDGAWSSGPLSLMQGHVYTLSVNGPVTMPSANPNSGTVLNFAVPAPGAAALVGAAGLMARRRRA